jgi:hypothetical protein
MDEQAIRELVGDVRRGRLSGRRFVQTMAGVGLTAPMAAQILRAAGLAEAQPKPSTAVPTRAAQFIRMNDLVIQNVVVIPVIIRHAVFAVGNAIRGFDFSPFSGPLWRLVYWSREA